MTNVAHFGLRFVSPPPNWNRSLEIDDSHKFNDGTSQKLIATMHYIPHFGDYCPIPLPLEQPLHWG